MIWTASFLTRTASCSLNEANLSNSPTRENTSERWSFWRHVRTWSLTWFKTLNNSIWSLAGRSGTKREDAFGIGGNFWSLWRTSVGFYDGLIATICGGADAWVSRFCPKEGGGDRERSRSQQCRMTWETSSKVLFRALSSDGSFVTAIRQLASKAK